MCCKEMKLYCFNVYIFAPILYVWVSLIPCRRTTAVTTVNIACIVFTRAVYCMLSCWSSSPARLGEHKQFQRSGVWHCRIPPQVWLCIKLRNITGRMDEDAVGSIAFRDWCAATANSRALIAHWILKRLVFPRGWWTVSGTGIYNAAVLSKEDLDVVAR